MISSRPSAITWISGAWPSSILTTRITRSRKQAEGVLFYARLRIVPGDLGTVD